MRLLNYVDEVLDKHKVNIYIWLFAIPYVLYFIAFFGIWHVNPSYIQVISVIMQLYVALFLMIRFNPFIKHEFRPYDDRLIFASAFLLLTNAGVTSVFTQYVLNPITNATTNMKKII
jgi:hypothetical protein